MSSRVYGEEKSATGASERAQAKRGNERDPQEGNHNPSLSRSIRAQVDLPRARWIGPCASAPGSRSFVPLLERSRGRRSDQSSEAVSAVTVNELNEAMWEQECG